MRALLFLFLVSVSVSNALGGYDPMGPGGKVEVVDAEFTYPYRGGERAVPLKVYLPETQDAAPVLLFSHGLGGSRENNRYLGKHWGGRGYVVVVMQHAGSDTEVWRDAPPAQRLAAMKGAASAESFFSRVADVSATLDQLEKWGEEGGRFAGRLDLEKVGMSGHSFGAVTTQAVSGQSLGRAGKVSTEVRIDAAVAFSPSVPGVGDAGVAFGQVSVPWLLMTGTRDESAISARTTPESRREVFKALPDGGGDFYELVLEGGEHMAFSDRTLRGREQRNPNHHRLIKALSTAFWDAYLKGDEGAKAWLQGEGAKGLLEEGDVWGRK